MFDSVNDCIKSERDDVMSHDCYDTQYIIDSDIEEEKHSLTEKFHYPNSNNEMSENNNDFVVIKEQCEVMNVNIEQKHGLHHIEDEQNKFDPAKCNIDKSFRSNQVKRTNQRVLDQRYDGDNHFIEPILTIDLDEETYESNECGYSSSVSSNIVTHKRMYTGEKRGIDQRYGDDNYFIEPILTIDLDEETYESNECDYSSSVSSNIVAHKRMHTGEKLYKCNECDYSSADSSRLVRHKKRHTEGQVKAYKCNECDYTSNDLSNLERHNRRHTGEKPYKCNECDYVCTQSINLIKHIRTHTGKKPYKCNECDYSNADSSNIVTHKKRMHTDEKPYKCYKCDFSTTDPHKLVRHKKRHTGEKSYKCDECDYSCADPSSLVTHKKRTLPGEKPYKCNECNYSSCISRNLAAHVKRHTGKSPFECDVCDYWTDRPAKLLRHKRTHSGKTETLQGML